MTHKTKGIVLKTIKYGETSLIINMLTELFGIQSYLVNGVRTSGKQGSKSAMYQPGCILQLEVYHNETKNLQRIKEAARAYVTGNIYADVVKNCVALYIVEIIYNLVKQPEPNAYFYNFCEDSLLQLDIATNAVTANFPLYFSLQAPYFFGFRMNDLPVKLGNVPGIYLDLQEGTFSDQAPIHNHYLHQEDAHFIAELLKVMQPEELSDIKMNRGKRMELLYKLQDFYRLHVPDFAVSKTLEVMQEIFND